MVTVTHPGTNRARRRATTLISANAYYDEHNAIWQMSNSNNNNIPAINNALILCRERRDRRTPPTRKSRWLTNSSRTQCHTRTKTRHQHNEAFSNIYCTLLLVSSLMAFLAFFYITCNPNVYRTVIAIFRQQMGHPADCPSTEQLSEMVDEPDSDAGPNNILLVQ